MNQADDHLLAYGPCWACGRLFTFHPDLVPSIPIDPGTNRPADLGGDPANVTRQPVCENCIGRANENRRATGRPLIPVLPGAYLHN